MGAKRTRAKKENTLPKILLLLAFLTVGGLPARAQNLLVNPGFETGDLTGWASNGAPVTLDAAWAHSGNYGAFSSSASDAGVLSQTVTTIVGQTYDYSFWGAIPVGGGLNVLEMKINGANTIGGGFFSPTHPYLQYSGQFVASSAMTTVEVGFGGWPSNSGAADDTYFGPSSVPEIDPDSAVLPVAFVGLLLLASERRLSSGVPPTNWPCLSAVSITEAAI